MYISAGLYTAYRYMYVFMGDVYILIMPLLSLHDPRSVLMYLSCVEILPSA